ncbi:MAG TPA: hypothetical protein VGF26_29375 [Ramlibacter sp.]
MSGDGLVFGALEPKNTPLGHRGFVFLSTDPNHYQWAFLGADRAYRGMSLSFDGQRVVVGDAGENAVGGKVYTSQGNRTSGGTLGSITGGAGQMVEVTYQGNGRFTIGTYAGGPFSIR